jgi:hypothetical protein
MHLLNQHAVELLGLRNSAREAIENESIAALGRRDVVLDDANHLRSTWVAKALSVRRHSQACANHARKHEHCLRTQHLGCMLNMHRWP